MQVQEVITNVMNPVAAVAPAENINPEAMSSYDILRRWQPVGKRIIVKEPYVSDDKNPLFAVKVTPFIPHFGTDVYPYQDIVYPTPGNKFGPIPNPADVPVRVVTYDVPPPLSLVSAAFRYWTGTICYKFRVVSSALSQGYLLTAVSKNKSSSELIRGSNVHANKNTYWREVEGIGQTFQSFMLESHMQSDLSLSRHVVIEVPYNRPTPVVDTYDDQKYLGQGFEGELLGTPYANDFVVVGVRGAIFVGESQDLVIEMEICAGFDFRLFRQLNVDFTTWNQEMTKPDTFPSIVEKKNKTKVEEKKTTKTTAKDVKKTTETAEKKAERVAKVIL